MGEKKPRPLPMPAVVWAFAVANDSMKFWTGKKWTTDPAKAKLFMTGYDPFLDAKQVAANLNRRGHRTQVICIGPAWFEATVGIPAEDAKPKRKRGRNVRK